MAKTRIVGDELIARIRAAQQPMHVKHFAAALAARQAQPLHVGSKNVRILVGRKRKGGLRARVRKRFAGLMHRVIAPAPAAPLQVTSFRGLPELAGVTSGVASEVASGVASGLGKVVKIAIGEEDEGARPKTPRIVGLRIS
jgi:hypothetical protein